MEGARANSRQIEGDLMSDNKIRALYQDIVRQMEKRADTKIASKKVAKARAPIYFALLAS